MSSDNQSDDSSSFDSEVEQAADRQGFLLPPNSESHTANLNTAKKDATNLNAVNSTSRKWQKQNQYQNTFVAPEILGYELQHQVGSGGTSLVYLANQIGSEQELAIKVFTGSVLDRNNLIRFEREVESLKKLQHSNIVQLYDYGVAENGSPYLVCEYVDGQSIDSFCQKQELNSRQIAQLLIPVCEAVAFANRFGVIHRDLKPSNILVTSKGQPLLIDFGLAKFRTVDSSVGRKPVDQTQTGAVLGTLNYLAPEQIFGRTDKLDATTDVFGIGGVLYKIFTGHPPFAFEHVIDAATSYFQQLPSRLDATVEVPAPMRRICLTCLSADPEDRYPTADAVAVQLKRFLQDKPIHAPSKPISSRVIQKLRKHRWLGTSVSALMAAVVCCSVIFLFQWLSTRGSLSRSESLANGLKNAMFDFSDEVRKQELDPKTIENRRRQLSLLSVHYGKLLPELATDIEFMMEAAITEHKLGSLEHQVGRHKVAHEHFGIAYDRFDAVLKLQPKHEKARFGAFHSLFSLGDRNESAYRTIQELLKDFPKNEDYYEAYASVGIQLASLQLSKGRVDGLEQSLSDLEASTQQRIDDTPSPKYLRHMARLNWLQARLATRHGKLDIAQQRLRFAAENQLKLNPLQAMNDSLASEYLDIARLSFSIAAIEEDRLMANRLLEEATTFYSQSKNAFVTHASVQWSYFTFLKDAAAYFDDVEDFLRKSKAIAQWKALVQSWPAETRNETDFNVVSLLFFSDPRMGNYDEVKSREAIEHLKFANYDTFLAVAIYNLNEEESDGINAENSRPRIQILQSKAKLNVLAKILHSIRRNEKTRIEPSDVHSTLSANSGYYEVSTAKKILSGMASP